MADESIKPALVRIAEHFDGFGVEFIVIGGQAAAIFGSPIPTYDVDLCYRRTLDNLERLAAALIDIHPALRDAPPDLPFRLDAQSLALGSNFTLDTDFGPLDLLGWIEPIGTYDDLIGRSERIHLDTVAVSVISFDDLLRIKRHLGRPKDRLTLLQLEAIQRDRDDRSENPSP